jgi:hypothetical protein
MIARRTRKESFLELEAPPPDLRDLPRFCHPRLLAKPAGAGQARPDPGLAPESALRSPGAILKDPMTTASAIDRLVHHSVILDLNIPSYRMEQAKKKKAEEE